MNSNVISYRAFDTDLDPGVGLAAYLQTGWRWADTALRTDIEQTIRRYVQRHPRFITHLKTAAACYHPVVQCSGDISFELASALLIAWWVADMALRAELEQLIRSYLQRHLAFVHTLRRAMEHFEQQIGHTHESTSDLQQFQSVFTRLTASG